MDLPLDFDSDVKNNVRSASFYHETDNQDGLDAGGAADGSTGSGPRDSTKNDSCFYYNSTVEMETNIGE